jgi:hypothetical protein
VRQFRFALRLTARQERATHRLVDAQCELYNAALQERRDTYRLAVARGHRPPRVNYAHQCRELTHILAERPELAAYGTVVSRGTLRRLERAFAAFYRRVAAGQTPGFPRYRSRARFDSVSYEDRSGWKLDPATGRLHLLGVGEVRVRLHRPIPDGARQRACVVRRERVVRRRGHALRGGRRGAGAGRRGRRPRPAHARGQPPAAGRGRGAPRDRPAAPGPGPAAFAPARAGPGGGGQARMPGSPAPGPGTPISSPMSSSATTT